MRTRVGWLLFGGFLAVVSPMFGGCGYDQVTSHWASPMPRKGCNERSALQIAQRRELPDSSTPPSDVYAIGGSTSDGWLFGHRSGFYLYVGPQCNAWYPVTVGAMT
jgi:hypothetical protein